MIQLRIIEPGLRGQGIGTMLSDYFENAVRKMGVEWFLSYAIPSVAEFHKKRGSFVKSGYSEIYKEL